MMLEIIRQINNREIAILIWVSAIFLFAIYKDKDKFIGKSILTILSLLKGKLGVVFFVFFLRIILCCYVLKTIDLWNVGLIKDSILWYLFTGLVALGDGTKKHHLKTTIFQTFTVSAILIFLSNLYPFSLIGEIFFVFISLLTGAMLGFTQYNKQYIKLQNPLKFIAMFLSISAIINTIHHGNIYTYQNLLAFLLPILLTVLSIPFFYGIALYSEYDSAYSE